MSWLGSETPTRTVTFYASGAHKAGALASALIERSAAFTVDPYPDNLWRFDVKPEQEAFVLRLNLGLRRTA